MPEGLHGAVGTSRSRMSLEILSPPECGSLLPLRKNENRGRMHGRDYILKRCPVSSNDLSASLFENEKRASKLAQSEGGSKLPHSGENVMANNNNYEVFALPHGAHIKS